VVVLALDTSGSVPGTVLAGVRILTGEVLASLPRGSQVAIFSFDDSSRLVQERTADLGRVDAAIDAARSAGRYTALHDALFDASRYLIDVPPTRRAILLLTDGRDENSALVLEDALALATANAIPIFCVGIGDVQEPVLRRIAKLTGGDYVRLAGASGHALAEAIRSLPRPQPRDAEPGPEPEPEPATGGEPEPAPRLSSRALWAITLGTLAVLALLTAGLAVLIARGRKSPRRPAAASPPPTLIGRTPGLQDVPQTLLLQPRAALRIVAGPGRGREIRLDPEQGLSLGRSHANELVLEDEAISGQHCRIRHEDEGWVLHDLGSTNGTRVNERRVDRHRLRGGDLISLGETSLQFLER
jgi:hypothetical protein